MYPIVRVAVVYPYLAHYREPIFGLLSRQTGRVRYTMIADTRSNVSALQLIAPERAKSNGGPIAWRNVRNRWIFKKLLWQHGLLAMTRRRDFDCLIFLGDAHYLSTWAAALCARLRGQRVLMWTHGYLKQEHGAKALVRRAFYRLAHGWLLYGGRARQIMLASGFSPERIHIVYNSLDFRLQSRIYAELRRRARQSRLREAAKPAGVPRIIYIGRLTGEKKLDLLLDAMQKLSSRRIGAKLVMVGEGPARGDLESQAQQLGISASVQFYGACYEEARIGEVMYESDLCVCPGSVGLTAMHAMAYGLPVVTHDDFDRQKPEFEAIVAGETGDFYRWNNSESLADTIAHWLATRPDTAVVRRRCRTAIRKRYTPEVQLKVIEAAVLQDE